MSRYLVRRIEENPAISLHTRTEIVGLEGGEFLERVSWRNNATGDVEQRDIRHVFVMAGAVPATQWADGCLALDDKGFILTGADLPRETLIDARWPHAARLTCSKRACPACLRSATCGRATSSA